MSLGKGQGMKDRQEGSKRGKSPKVQLPLAVGLLANAGLGM